MVQSAALTTADKRALAGLRQTPNFMRRLHVEDEKNARRPLREFWPEQAAWVRALLTSKQVLGLKPRQLGFTTITTLFLVDKAIKSRHPRKFLQMVHEDQAMLRVAKMLRVAVEGLPSSIRPRYRKNNIETTILELFDRNGKSIDGAQFTRLLAGGKGQARSWTYNDIHATEMAHWARATSAANDEGDLSADEEAFASALATKHDPDGHVIVESTGNGPSGLFFKLYETSQRKGSGWAFVFVPWTSVRRYSLDLTDHQCKALEADLTDEEKDLIRRYRLTLGQVAWRRWKMADQQLSPLAFRRNYPITSKEPFLLDENAWFNLEALNFQLTTAEQAGLLVFPEGDLYVWEDYDPDRCYVMGGDPSGGTGNDEACFTVFSDDLVQVAMWVSAHRDEGAQALEASRLGGMYGSPLAVIESNKYGAKVIELLASMGGVRLWKDPQGKDFWADNQSKLRAFMNARDLINGYYPVLRDPVTISQLMSIIDSNGRIKARTGHDDRAFATVYAMWAWLSLNFEKPRENDDQRTRIMRILRQFNVSPGPELGLLGR